MKRRQKELYHAIKEYKLRNTLYAEYQCSAFPRELGRFRKKRAFSCNRPRCLVCHSDKYPKREETHQERCASLKLEEGINEINSEQ